VSKLPDFEGLTIFAKVVQKHSFVGAATELRLSKATVSKAVTRIERKLGTRLFNRLALTESGRQLYDRAARVLAEAVAAEDDGMAQSAAPLGHVRLTAPMSYGLLHIAPILSEFLERYPAVTIDLHLSDSHVDLLGEGYDAAIRSHPCPTLP
jgi:DNA-binding transcriptional LysR family regulator